MTAAEARWRAQRTQQLLSEGLGRFEAIADAAIAAVLAHAKAPDATK